MSVKRGCRFSKIYDFQPWVVGQVSSTKNISLFLSRPYVQLESCQLLPKYVYKYFPLRVNHTMLVIDGFIVSQLKASPQRQAFRSDLAMYMYPKYMVSSAIGTYLSSTSERLLPRAVSIAYNVLEVFWTILANNSKESFPYLVLGFLLDSLQLLKGALSAQKGLLHLNYM